MQVVRHSGLLSQLTASGAESKGVSGASQGSFNTTEWRYAAVESLWLTAEVIHPSVCFICNAANAFIQKLIALVVHICGSLLW